MARHIRIYVKNDLFHGSSIPPPTNHRFNPTFKYVRNYICKVAVKCKFLKLDQADLELKDQEREQQQQPNDNFFFRGYREKLANDEDVIDMDCEEMKV